MLQAIHLIEFLTLKLLLSLFELYSEIFFDRLYCLSNGDLNNVDHIYIYIYIYTHKVFSFHREQILSYLVTNLSLIGLVLRLITNY